ncbi:MAG TPA: hypothetical protein VND42_06145 [Candidatus Acidoferrales bacterium]|nr:hypothetical protein [Candidatus Acidoferrales bacterium]
MSRLLRQLSVALLMVTACAASGAQTDRPVSHVQKSRKIVHGECDPRKMTFRATIAADGPSADGGTRLSYHVYKASNGITLQTVFGDFDSPSEAKAELEYRAKFAGKIIVRSMKLDPKGNVIGKRVEALLPRVRSKDLSVFAVMWTSGRYFHEITSDCEDAALYTEKKIRDPE